MNLSPAYFFRKTENEIALHVSITSSAISWTRCDTSLFADTGCHIWLSQITKFLKFCVNYLLLVYKLNVYNSRDDKVLCLNKFQRDITKVKKIKKREGCQSRTKVIQYKKK